MALAKSFDRPSNLETGYRPAPSCVPRVADSGVAMETVLALTPSHKLDATIAIAAARAGAVGILDLGFRQNRSSVEREIVRLRDAIGAASWGVRWDTLGLPARGMDRLAETLPFKVPLLLIGGREEPTAELLCAARRLADRVVVEASDAKSAVMADAAGYDGVIANGSEVAGRVSKTASYILAQELRGLVRIPYWIRGGVGPRVAAATLVAGAKGWVLAEQLWLSEEGPWFLRGKKLPDFDGSESVVLGRDDDLFRISARHGRSKFKELELACARGGDWRQSLEAKLADDHDPIIPLGQDIALAAPLARRYGTTGRIIQAIRSGAEERIRQAAELKPLAPESALAKAHGVRYPILQGPMTRVSDVAPFAKSVSEADALPFLALAVMPGPQARELLLKARETMGGKPWGVGMLGFLPLELRQAQMEAIKEIKPPYAIIAGGRPSQAREMEELGVSTYLHVPSPALLQGFINEGARNFIFEGSECGGHTGPRSSFILWESALEVLLASDVKDPSSFRILFAGGVHDEISAAMVSILAAPLVERGMAVGVLMGTAYLFTEEAVRSGAVTQGFQDEALTCRDTALLQSGVGIYTRCAKTAFCDEFDDARRKLLLEGKSENDILMALELLNIGRLRIASKGVVRNETPESGGRYRPVDLETQRRDGLYMMGEVARLRSQKTTMAALHEAVTIGAGKELDAAAGVFAKPTTSVTSASGEPIAVVGMACLMPQANDVETYWRNILLGVDTIREVPPDRWRMEDYFDPNRGVKDKVYSKWGGFLEDIAFEPAAFGIPPASLSSIEPVQLLALYVAKRALQDAGFDQRPFPRDRTATIFASGAMNDLGTEYVFRTLLAKFLPRVEGISKEAAAQIKSSLYTQDLPNWTSHSFPGFLGNVVAGRVANRLDLRGANFTVDAACGSGLAALEVGVRQLRHHSADVALVGAVDATNGPVGFMSFAQTLALSPRGRCRPFDESADGIALGEAIAAVVLKRLSDAERDGDHIYAVIKGVGSSSDGRSRTLTAPSSQGQVLALQRAYEDAGVDIGSVTLIEAHGTGTVLGDRSEVEALSMAFPASQSAQKTCAVGSVKSMIGHTKIAAGLASIIKASLALDQRVLPPTIGVERPLPQFEPSPFYVNTETRPWITRPADQPRRCGVSAFGFGGTNFHTVLEEYQGEYREHDARDLNPRNAEIFTLCRSTRADLENAATTLLRAASETSQPSLAQLAYSWHLDEAKARPKNGGQVFHLSIVATSADDLKTKLRSFSDESNGGKPAPGVYFRDKTNIEASGKVCFLFPGQGSQQLNMLRDLVTSRRASHTLFERADALLEKSLSRPLSSYIFPPPALSKVEADRQKSELNDTRIAQPALGVVELAAYDLLSEFGLRPHFLAGHSFGEYVALCVAGAMSREELIRLSEARGRISAKAGGGQKMAMAAVNAAEARVAEAIAGQSLAVEIASLNAPDQTIIAGAREAIEEAIKAFDKENVRAMRLAVTAAFHTQAMGASLGELVDVLDRIDVKTPATPVFSNTIGKRFPDEPQAIKTLLGRHLVEPLRFVDEIQELYDEGARVFVECGPGVVLSRLTDNILGKRPHATLSLDVAGRPGWQQLAHVLAQCVTLGLPVNLDIWFRNRGLAPVGLEEALQRARASTNPPQLAWRVNGGRAEPWYAAKTSATGRKRHSELAPAKREDQRPEPAPSIPSERPASNGVIYKFDRRSKVQTDEQSHRPAAPPPTAPNIALSPSSFGAEVQSNLSSLIDLQRQQQETLWRFMEFQERLMNSGLSHSSPAAFAASAAAASLSTEAAPLPVRAATTSEPLQRAAEPPAALARRIVPPAPVLPKFVTSPSKVEPKTQVQALNGTAAPTPERRGPEPAVRTPKAAEAPALPPTPQFKNDLIRVVAERTGYTEEMLDLDAHVEADLGIDSIKRIEIFSELKDHYPFMEGRDQETVFEELSNLKTLSAVVAWYDSLRSADKAGGSETGKKSPTPSQSSPEATESSNMQALAHDARRYAVIPLSAPLGADEQQELLSSDRVLLAIGAPETMSSHFRAALAARHCQFVEISAAGETKMVGANRAEVDFSSIDGVKKLSALLHDQGKRVGAIANFAMGGAEATQFEAARRLFLLLKAFESDLRSDKRGNWLLNITALDGHFGLRRTQRFGVLPAGTLGVAKTAAIEWPEVTVKCLDVDPDIDPNSLVEHAICEITSGDRATEVGFTAEGRFVLDLKPDSGEDQNLSNLSLERNSVLLVTGGAYGITSDIVKAFASKFKPIIILTGRSRLSEPESPETTALKNVEDLRKFLIEDMRAGNPKIKPVEIERALQRILKNREISRNLSEMRLAGARVEYHSIDLRDKQAFSKLIASIYESHGRIDGVLHGAGVVDDKLIRDKQLQSFDEVFSTKVVPAMVLAENLKPETLKFFVFFSSIAGRFGNAGQADYSAANEVINKLSGRLRVDWPHVQTVAINWGPWDGGMVRQELRAFFAAKDIYPIGLEEGTQRCLEELQYGADGPAEIVVTSSLDEIVKLTTRLKAPASAELTV
jgi:acyl transferase domain-containing protein/NAD(P)H-dependent flavin oxidoreductase YrpB (nitropropane dioxygenase family)/NAD(P)-dependent dehydrogenase (short-subunit alcohol dehydrogenase family)